ncbi:transcription termination/antitermination protein NusG [Pseudaminobacter sp. NGMCC 1.201702]|uniref:transcription termination/antitermination protein NusG n=1 Tax=Pseudaminobacter sp. NGMCC 1.201702 TaxID=3391825 RepID=UPI0039EDFB97
MKIKVPGCMSLAVNDLRWFAVRVRGGMADPVFAELQDAGYDVYLPRRRYDRYNRRMRVMSERSEPLLPGYLFVAHPRRGGQPDDWSEVRGVNGVVGPLSSTVAPLVIPAAVIEAIITAEFESAYDETAAAKRARGDTDRSRLEQRFKPGRQFVVSDGPFASFLAEADSITHDERVKTLVEIFGRMTPVVFEPEQLEDLPKKGKSKAA